jgi:hypothetical protein
MQRRTAHLQKNWTSKSSKSEAQWPNRAERRPSKMALSTLGSERIFIAEV